MVAYISNYIYKYCTWAGASHDNSLRAIVMQLQYIDLHRLSSFRRASTQRRGKRNDALHFIQWVFRCWGKILQIVQPMHEPVLGFFL